MRVWIHDCIRCLYYIDYVLGSNFNMVLMPLLLFYHMKLGNHVQLRVIPLVRPPSACFALIGTISRYAFSEDMTVLGIKKHQQARRSRINQVSCRQGLNHRRM